MYLAILVQVFGDSEHTKIFDFEQALQ